MAVHKNLTLSEFEREFRDCGRDHYSEEGYARLYDLLDEMDAELDVIAVCCEWTEMDMAELWDDYGHMVGGGEFACFKFESLLDCLEAYTVVLPLPNNSYLVAGF